MLMETLHGTTSTEAQPDGKRAAPETQNPAATSILLDFVRQLDDAGVPYCILHGYEGMPERWQSDIDLCVAHGALDRAVDYLRVSAERTGWAVCNLLEHEQCAVGLVLARQGPNGTVDFVIFDVCSDYRYNGLLYFDASALLDGRWSRNGLSVAAPGLELAYLLAKRTLKRSHSSEHVAHLVNLYRQDPPVAERLLRQLWSAPMSEKLIGDLRSASPALVEGGEGMRRQLRRRGLLRTVRESPQAFGLEALRLALRSLRPIGVVIAVLGPDGAGKSTVIAALDEQVTPLYRRGVHIHLRPRLFGPQTDSGITVPDPHARPDRSGPASIAKLGLYASEHLLSHLFRIRPQLVRGCLVLYDRYFDDICVDPRRYRYGGPLWLVSLLGKVLPRPDCMFVLDAPVAVLHARKQEVPADEAERQRAGYQQLAAASPNCVVIDASRPVEAIIAEVNGHLLNCMRSRVEKRMRRIGGRLWTIAG